MAYGDGSVTRIGLLHHQHGHRFTHDVATTQDDTFLAFCVDVVALQQFEDAVWRGRHVAGQANGETSHIDGVETVHVLTVVNSFDYFLFGDVLGQGELHDEAVHVGIVVQFTYLGQQFFFGHVGFVANETRFETAYFAGFYFSSYICFATTIVSHQDSGQMGAFASVGHDFRHFGGNLLLHLF